MTVMSRGTSNSGKNGSAEGRRRRKRWLIKTYRADVDVLVVTRSQVPMTDDERLILDYLERLLEDGSEVRDQVHYARSDDLFGPHVYTVPQGYGEAATRCYRCGKLLWFATVEVDRIVPGWRKTSKYPRGGTYVRENIRPACGGPKGCNIITGNEDRWKSHKPFRLFAELLDCLTSERDHVNRQTA